MNQLQVVSFANVNDAKTARSFYRVQLADGTAPEYDIFGAIRMRSLKHAYDAEDNPGAYRFYDDDGVLEIQPAPGPPPGPPPGAMLPPDLPPPDVLIQTLQTGAMPPGVTPDMILQLLAAQGAPPELLQQLAQGVRQQGAIQPQGLAGPGVPPQMQGQLTPEMLNMGVGQGAEAAPGIYQQMIGQPLGEDEELDRMAMLAQLRQR